MAARRRRPSSCRASTSFPFRTRVPLDLFIIPRAASRVASSPFRNSRSAFPKLPSLRSMLAHACQLGACDPSASTAFAKSFRASVKFLSSTSSSAQACDVAARVGSARRHSLKSLRAFANRPFDRSNTAHAWYAAA